MDDSFNSLITKQDNIFFSLDIHSNYNQYFRHLVTEYNFISNLHNYFLNQFRLIRQFRVAPERKCLIIIKNIIFTKNQYVYYVTQEHLMMYITFKKPQKKYLTIKNRFFPNLNSQLSIKQIISKFLWPHTTKNITKTFYKHIRYSCIALTEKSIEYSFLNLTHYNLKY